MIKRIFTSLMLAAVFYMATMGAAYGSDYAPTVPPETHTPPGISATLPDTGVPSSIPPFAIGGVSLVAIGTTAIVVNHRRSRTGR